MFDVVNFIEMVREQRCLWDTSSEEYYNKTLTESAWICVATRFYHDFQYVSLETTDERVKEMKKKWRSIQNKFHRYVNQACPASKKKTYMYAEYLQFLLVNTSELRLARRSCKKSRRTEGPLDEDNKSVDESSEVEEPTPGPSVSQSLKPSILIIKNKSHSTECQTKQTNNNTSSLEQEQDADKMFLLSLLPDFKSMHEEDNKSVDESSEVKEPTPGPSVSQSLKPSILIIKNKSHSTECQTKQTNNNTSSLEQEQDADKMFLLSLLPDFKSMHEEDKLDFRIMTMQFMRYVKRKRRMKTTT